MPTRHSARGSNVGVSVTPFEHHRIAGVCAILGLFLVFPAGAAGKFESRVSALRPSVPGLTLRVVEGERKLELENKTRKTVVVKGYDDEQYLRFRPGIVERNILSPATYLNVDRFGGQAVPPRARRGVRPRWSKVAAGDTYRWFDHRIHLTVKRVPRELRGAKTVKKVFDWEVPLTVDGRPVLALGTLSWNPSSSSGDGFPVWIAVSLAALALIGIGSLVIFRRRRGRPAGKPEKEPVSEAW
jgi:hypothetical protein